MRQTLSRQSLKQRSWGSWASGFAGLALGWLGVLVVCALILGGAYVADRLYRRSNTRILSPLPNQRVPVTLHVPQQFKTLAEAITAASQGDTVKIAPGVFDGTVKVDKSVVLEGAGSDQTVIETLRGPLEMVGTVRLQGVNVRGGPVGVHVHAGADATLQHVSIRSCSDGLLLEHGASADVVITQCNFEENVNGINLKSGQAVIAHSRFAANRDQGINLDGDAHAVIYRTEFFKNHHAGIKATLGRDTYLVVVSNRFEGQGQDGLELIDGPSGGNRNVILVAQNVFEDNCRYAIGAFDRSREQSGPATLHARLWGNGNRFPEAGVGSCSPSLVSLGLGHQAQQDPVTVELSNEEDHEQQIKVELPVPLAVFPMPELKDAEDIALQSTYQGLIAWISDDRAEAVWKVSLTTADVLQRFDMDQFFTRKQFNHPEGITLFQGSDGIQMMLSDDDARTVATFSIEGNTLVAQELTSTALWHQSPEDLEFVGNTLYLLGDRLLTAVDMRTRQVRPGYPIRYRPNEYARHVVGLGYDGVALLITTTSNEASPGALLRVNPQTGDVLGLWSLGDFVRDPRGVAAHNGLVYVVDGNPPDPRYRIWCFALSDLEDITPYATDLLTGRTF